MSDVETYNGKLIPIDREGLSFEEWVKKELGVDEKPDFETWESFYEEEIYKNRGTHPEIYYNHSNDVLYRVEKTAFDREDFVISKKLDDGSYEFTISWYNGGASIGEVLDEVVESAS